MTGQPIHFDEPPQICPNCMTNTWRQVAHPSYLPADEERGFPRELLRVSYETVCGTCNPGPRRTYVDGVDLDAGRGPFNL